MSVIQADLLIVGAGMVGSTLALALKKTGLNIVLLENRAVELKSFSVDTPFEPRVSAISLASRAILESVNAWKGILDRRYSPYQEMYVWDGSGTGHIQFDAKSVHQASLGFIIENRVIQDALLEELQEQDSIQLFSDVQLETLQQTAVGWKAILHDGRVIETKLVIGADGARSQVRQFAGLETREWDYFHQAIVTSVRCEKNHQKTAWQRFTDQGPLAFLPLSLENDDHWCSIVWSLPPSEAEKVMALDDTSFCSALEQAFEGKLGKVLHADARYCIPLRQRHAKRYVKKGLAVIGDAAHVIHPLAGQGVNLGLMDAAILAETIQTALVKHEEISDLSVLKRFECRRMPYNLRMMALMETFERLFQSDQVAIRWLRNVGLRRINTLPEIKAMFVRQALGLDGDLPKMASV